MRFFAASITFLTFACSALSASIPTIEKYDGKTNGKHIVQMKKDADKTSLLEQVKAANGQVTYEYTIINGFAGSFSEQVLSMILSNPSVESVSEDGIMSINGQQKSAPWGLARISGKSLKKKDPAALNYVYDYPNNALGSDVDIYIVDTGVLIEHAIFGRRARWGYTFGPYEDEDGNGHGTHVAGTAAGYQYGVAQNANIIAVKVLSDKGDGEISDIIAGLGWIMAEANRSGRPSVVNLSLGGGASSPLDGAVLALTSTGVHVAVAAGNSNKNAKDTSPARAPTAITVAASTINDARASFSNYGAVVDVFAPGESIISAWINSNSATKSISGTSMACPHVAGLIAYFISAEKNISPEEMSKKIQRLAKQNVLTGIPRNTGTHNLLAQNH